jgi:lysosomal acid lipase/cholesteryl ester hydrolase
MTGIRLPIISRLAFSDYWHIAITLALLVLEWWIRLIFKFIPARFHPFIKRRVSGIMRKKKQKDVFEMVRDLGYELEEHLVPTDDGFILGVQRIREGKGTASLSGEKKLSLPPSPAKSLSSVSDTVGQVRKRPPILFLSGCMLNSEVWFCHKKSENNLPIYLSEQGFDIWLLNRRGSKYSSRHLRKKPTEEGYWDFCLDDSALYDIPSAIRYNVEF